MTKRLACVLWLAAVSLTAFAPAPLPRRATGRPRDSVEHAALVGKWRATKLLQTGNPQERDPATNGVATVTVTATQWIFNKDLNSTATYDLHVDHLKQPAEVDFRYPGQTEAYGRGVIRREGNALRVVYNWGSPRPEGFEGKQTGHWDLTLVRE